MNAGSTFAPAIDRMLEPIDWLELQDDLAVSTGGRFLLRRNGAQWNEAPPRTWMLFDGGVYVDCYPHLVDAQLHARMQLTCDQLDEETWPLAA